MDKYVELVYGRYIQSSFGTSVANGYSTGGSIGRYGMEASGRPGGYTFIGAGVVVGTILFPQVTIPALITP